MCQSPCVLKKVKIGFSFLLSVKESEDLSKVIFLLSFAKIFTLTWKYHVVKIISICSLTRAKL